MFCIIFERNENIPQYFQLLQGISSDVSVFQYMMCKISMKSSETPIPQLQIINFSICHSVVCTVEYFMISYKILNLGIFTAVLLNIKIFWNVIQCGLRAWLALEIIQAANLSKVREYLPISTAWLKFYKTI
jgi:hypothetical protein